MSRRRIFRESAVRRYNERLERIELPRPVTVPWRRVTWAAAGLMLVLAALLLAARVPVYADGPGVVVADGEGTAVVALLPAGYAGQLQPGQAALVSLAGATAGAALPATVLAVEPQPLSPAAARARYDLDATTGALIEGPVAVARVSFDQPAAEWLGSVASVRVEVAHRSGLALLPGIGPLLSPAPENGQ